MAEDLDDDCVVTVIDIMEVASRWGEGSGSPGDLNGDGTVDIGDIQQVAGLWRETCHVLAEVVKYYALGGQRIAMRRNNTLYYLFSDHLNSTSVTYRTSDGQTTTQRYYPWGTIHPGPDNILPTDYTFTGQKLDTDTGLLYYSDGTGYGRYYDPLLGRWTQPDSIVPNYRDPQSLNRYSYVTNRPTVLTDPDGHCGPVCAALYALWETFFGHGVSSAGGDLYDPETGEPCGDTGCVTPSKPEAEVAAGVALDVAVVETGGRAVNKVAQKGAGILRRVLPGAERTLNLEQRAQSLLTGEPGYNVSPEAWFSKYKTIGRTRTYLTDKRAISDVIGQFEGRGNTISITAEQAAALEKALGLERGSLANGFRISRIEGIAGRNPGSPIVGNEYFLGPGKGLAGGGPELTIDPISTQGGSGIIQIIVRVLGE